MKMFFAIENNMNGALVIPKLMLIKFCCLKDRQLYRGDQKIEFIVYYLSKFGRVI